MLVGLGNRCSPTRGLHTRTSCSLPSEVEGLVVAPGRAVARALVDFLRGEGIHVRTVTDAERGVRGGVAAPARRRADRRSRPADRRHRAVQRLKANVRTHFVPAILCAHQRSAARTGARVRGRRRRRVRAGDRCGRSGARACGRCYARARCIAAANARSARRTARSSTAGNGCRSFCTTSRGRSARWQRTSITWPSSAPSAAIPGARTSTTASRTRAACSSSSRPACAPSSTTTASRAASWSRKDDAVRAGRGRRRGARRRCAGWRRWPRGRSRSPPARPPDGASLRCTAIAS